MTVSIVVPDVEFTKYSRVLKLPKLSLAKAFYLLGDSLDASDENRAGSPSGSLSAVGTPTYEENYAVLGQSNGFNLGFINDWPFTYMAIAHYKANLGGIIGHWTSSNTAKDSLYFSSSSGGSLVLAIEGEPRVSITGGIPTSGFIFTAATYDGETASVYAYDGENLLSNSGAFEASVHPDANTRIAGSTGSPLSGAVDVAAAATWQTALEADDIATMYLYMKALMAARGIDIY